MHYGRDAVVAKILDRHRESASGIVKNSGSKRLQKAFKEKWDLLNHGHISTSTKSQMIKFNTDNIISKINRWVTELENCKEEEMAKFRSLEERTPEDIRRNNIITRDIYQITVTYGLLKSEIQKIEQEFANAARSYRSPIRQALTDMRILYNSIHNIKGNFSEFKNVSIYIHGIESDGNDFLKSAMKASEVGDVIVHEKRDGTKEYYMVSVDKAGNKFINKKPLSFEQIKDKDQFKNAQGRLHIVYDTEHKNEHRQETSNDLAERLSKMGLINDSTRIDFYAHSYGGRRSFQFAVDYPDSVRSITTIGTPYDTNTLGAGANKFSFIHHISGERFSPKQNSDYLDFNNNNKRTDKDTDHSNVYTDMDSQPLVDEINKIKSANPEVYRKLENMNITAVAGVKLNKAAINYPMVGGLKGDDIVSIKSQHGESLGKLIDERPQYFVSGMIGHLNEITNSEYIELIRTNNKLYKE